MNSDSRSERIASTWPICDSVSTVNTMVCQCASRSWIAQACAQQATPPPISSPTQRMCCHMPWAKMLSFGGRGGRCMIAALRRLAASASPGRPSVTRLIHRMWIGSSGIGSPRNGARKIVQISPELLVMA